MTETSKTPITVLGGWLGAGKTTMVNRLLRATNERLAIIVNDVGDVNVDAEFLREDSDDSDGVIELTNGCICCKVGDDLFATLAELSRREPAPERVVIETSGVAEPRQVVGFLEHPRFHIDAVITLAEGKNFEYRSSGPPYGSLMRVQLAGADLVVATKLDLVANDAERDASLAELRQFTKAQVIEARHNPEWLNAVMLGVHDNPEHQSSEGSTTHVATATWRPTGPADVNALRAALLQSGLLRAKGSLATNDGAMLVHLAGGRVKIDPLDDNTGPLDAIVLIGQTAEQLHEVSAALDATIVASNT